MGDSLIRLCRVCDEPVDNNDFGAHIDGHSDAELDRWPGGITALEKELVLSMMDLWADA